MDKEEITTILSKRKPYLEELASKCENCSSYYTTNVSEYAEKFGIRFNDEIKSEYCHALIGKRRNYEFCIYEVPNFIGNTNNVYSWKTKLSLRLNKYYPDDVELTYKSYFFGRCTSFLFPAFFVALFIFLLPITLCQMQYIENWIGFLMYFALAATSLMLFYKKIISFLDYLRLCLTYSDTSYINECYEIRMPDVYYAKYALNVEARRMILKLKPRQLLLRGNCLHSDLDENVNSEKMTLELDKLIDYAIKIFDSVSDDIYKFKKDSKDDTAIEENAGINENNKQISNNKKESLDENLVLKRKYYIDESETESITNKQFGTSDNGYDYSAVEYKIKENNGPYVKTKTVYTIFLKIVKNIPIFILCPSNEKLPVFGCCFLFLFINPVFLVILLPLAIIYTIMNTNKEEKESLKLFNFENTEFNKQYYVKGIKIMKIKKFLNNKLCNKICNIPSRFPEVEFKDNYVRLILDEPLSETNLGWRIKYLEKYAVAIDSVYEEISQYDLDTRIL